jgi:hypothetical protein
MKNRSPKLFSDNDRGDYLKDEKYQIRIDKLLPGHVYKIGKPSGLYYQYIYPDSSTQKQSFEFEELNGMLVKVLSIINLSGGKVIAALVEHKDVFILNKFEKIFARVDMAISNLEILPLDLEMQKILECDQYSRS